MNVTFALFIKFFSYPWRTEFLFPTFSYKMTCFLHYVGNGFYILFSFSPLALPVGKKIEDLLTLASQYIEPTTDELMEDRGMSFLHKHQKLMLQHYGNTDMTILPDNLVQHMLLGVSIPPLSVVLLSQLFELRLRFRLCTQNELLFFSQLELWSLPPIWRHR